MQDPNENDNAAELSQKKRTRRKRNCEDERQYKCGKCSKTYLSNAALYTHVKNKHEGGNKENQKDGSGSQISNQSIEEQQEDDEPIVEDFKEQNLQTLRHVLKKYFPERNKSCSIKQITQGLSLEHQQFFIPLLTYWNQNWQKPYVRELETIDKVIGQFLFLMNKRVSSMCLNFLLRVFFYMREGLFSETNNKEYCQKQTPANLPNYFNNLLMKRYIPPQQAQEDELMNNSILICQILQYFGLWLYDEKYTNYKLHPNHAGSNH